MISRICPQNQWPKSAFELAVRLEMLLENEKFKDKDYVGVIRTKSNIEREWLTIAVPAGNA